MIITMPRNLESLLKILRVRSSMYLGLKEISRLEHFLNGFKCCEEIYKIKGKNTFDWNKFESYIAKKYNKNSKSIRSFSIALILSDKNEEKAFDLWFKWYDEYRDKNL